MSSLFDDENREEPKPETDLTLGIGSLLSIFFGIVLICGIFFGFGYSMGRRNAHPAPAVATTAPADAPETAPAPTPVPETTTPAPAPASTTGDTSQAKAQDAPAPQAEDADTPKVVPAPVKRAPALSVAPAPVSRHESASSHQHMGIKAPLEQAEGDSALTPGHPIMVQIAAISRRADADVLASALQRRGFTPVVRPGTADHLFHVQIGPFSSKSQAEDVKQRLLSDGYNAILK